MGVGEDDRGYSPVGVDENDRESWYSLVGVREDDRERV